MSKVQFERRWRTSDYNKLTEEGGIAVSPEEMKEFGPRRSYGRNGNGRHSAFRFGDPSFVRTWCNGHEVTYEVQRGLNVPFDLKLVGERDAVPGQGTEVSAPGGASA